MSLISPNDLLARLPDSTLRLLDVRWWLTDLPKGRRDYEAAHIPGACWVDMDSVLTAPSGPGRHPLPSPGAFTAAMLSLGVRDDSSVVVYDDNGGTIAARLWWMLDSLGFASVHVLDGGLPAWVAAGGPVTAVEPAPDPAPAGSLHLASAWAGVVDRAWVAGHLGRIILVDARAPERYRGDVEPVDRVPGHIPTAVSRPLAGNLGPDGRFLPPAALRARFADPADAGAPGPSGPSGAPGIPGAASLADGLVGGLAADLAADLAAVTGFPGADGPAPVVHSCGSGINACHNLLAARVAGLPDALLYEGSYSDWTRSGMPVATGDEPGASPF